MERYKQRVPGHVRAAFVAIAVLGACSDSSSSSATVPVPTAQAVARTDTSIPWAADDLRYTPIILSERGYQQQEYFLSGTANVYDWPDTSKAAVVKTANVPYTSVAMVWTPTDPKRFSGNVIIEVGNATAGYDQANIWQQLHELVMRNGDVYIEMNSQAGTLAKYLQYDKTRYASLNWTPPSATSGENGLFWDIYSQAAAWARSSSFPVQGVKTVIGTGSSQSSVMLNTYVNAVLPLSLKADGKPVFDGFLQQNGPNYFAINSTAKAPYSVPERGIVPIIRLASSADFANMMGPSDNPPLSSRRADSDSPGDQYRLYELACSIHNQVWMNMYRVGFAQLNKIGVNSTLSMTRDATVTPDTVDFPNWAFLNAQLINLYDWIQKGIAPPKDLPRLEYVAMNGPEQIEYKTDAYGNPLGGIRNPWCDVPTATIVPHAYTYYNAAWCSTNPCYSGSGSFTRNYKIPFTTDQLTALYGTNVTYTSKALASLESLVTARLILPDDAVALRTMLLENPVLMP